MPYAAPYQQKYPPTQRTKNKPMGAWGSLFDNGQPAQKLYGGNQQPAPGYGGTMFTPGAAPRGPMAPMASNMGRMSPAQSGGFLGAYGGNPTQAQPGASSAFMQRAAMAGQQPQMGGYGGSVARRIAEPAQPMPYASMPIGRATMPTMGSRNQSAASIQDINSRLLIDPTNIQAQFSSQLGQPSADESALSAWEAMRNASPVTRESLLAQANNGGRLTSGLASGIDDPNYNRDGRFFQGAVPTQDARGRVSFTTREQADPGAAEREARRLQHMEQLKARQGGDRPPQPYLQRGTAALSSPSDLPQFANKDLQAQRRATQAERMARVTQRAAAMAEQRKESLAARRRGPSVMDMLMQRNPALAVQMQEVQQRGQIAQAQMQNQMAMQKEANAGNLAVANAQGANQLNGINAQIGGNKEVAQIQAGVQKELAGLQREVENRKITVDEARAKAEALNAGAGLLAGLAAAGVQSGQQIPPETMNSLATILGLAGPRTSAVAGAPGAGAQPAAPPVAQGPFGPAQGGAPQPSRDVNAKIYAGGKLNDADLGVIKNAFAQSADKAFQIAMNQYGLSRQEAVDLINSDLIGNSWMWERTPEAPGYWESLLWSPGTRGPGGYEGWSKRP